MAKLVVMLLSLSMLLAVMPVGAVAMTMSLSSTTGVVGSKTTVSGTIVTYNGQYQIWCDADKDPATGVLGFEVQLTGATNPTANGYAFSYEVTIPDCYNGGVQIAVIDLTAAAPGNQISGWYTVSTVWKLEVNKDYAVEGANGVTATATVTGADKAWNGKFDLQIRVSGPAGAIAGETQNVADKAAAATGKYVHVFNLPVAAASYNSWGTYTVTLDTDGAGAGLPAGAWGKVGAASDTFIVRMTDGISYQRTAAANYQAYVPAGGAALDEVVRINPDGTKTVLGTGLAVAAGTLHPGAPGALFVGGSLKNTALGTYTLQYLDIADNVLKSQTFTLTAAQPVITMPLGTDYQDTQTVPAAAAVDITVVAGGVQYKVERKHTVVAKLTIKYPDGVSFVTAGDVPNGFTVNVYKDTTFVASVPLVALTDYDAVNNKWVVRWTVPEGAALGKDYRFEVAANSITDIFSNMGPANAYNTASTTGLNKAWECVAGKIYVTTGPTLNFPATGNTLARASTAQPKVLVEFKYADGTSIGTGKLKWFNLTVRAVGKNYNFVVPETDFNSGANLWLPAWTIPYNAPIGASDFLIDANDVVDLWGNKGPVAATADTADYNIGAASISVANVKTDAANYQTDQEVTVTFDATYPNGSAVTTKAAAGFQKVTVLDSTGANLFGAGNTKAASWNAALGKWVCKFTIPAGSPSGVYTARIVALDVQDDATVPNTGPTIKQEATFEVARVSLIDVLNASNNAKAAADLAKIQADAAKIAADAAKAAADAALAAANTAATKADAAATAATTAGTKADAATAAATAAGTKADAATAAATAAGTKATAAETAAKAAQTAATDAGTKATSAETAAKAAQTAATGATTSADAAKKAADAATAAANAAKTSADAASSKIDSLQTLVYGAIGASLIAAAAAIVALMQISRKIA